MEKYERTADAMLRDGFAPAQAYAISDALREVAERKLGEYEAAAAELAISGKRGLHAASNAQLVDEMTAKYASHDEHMRLSGAMSLVARAMLKLMRQEGDD